MRFTQRAPEGPPESRRRRMFWTYVRLFTQKCASRSLETTPCESSFHAPLKNWQRRTLFKLRMLPQKKRPAASCILMLRSLQSGASHPEQTSELAGRLGSCLGCWKHPLQSRDAVLFPTIAFRRAAVQVSLCPVPSGISRTKGFRVFTRHH